MTEIKNKKYDLEERTLKYAKDVRNYIRVVHKDIPNVEYSRQLIRSSGSIGANYIEANECLSKKDFAMRIKICRKESKETIYWLNLFDDNPEERNILINEGVELMKIFGAILEKIKV